MKGLQQFAGIVHFYHRSVPNAAHIMRHYAALASKPITLVWPDDLEEFTTARV